MTRECPFCKAVDASQFATSERFRALYNVAPILPGHSLVIPKRHVETLMDLSEDELHEMVSFARHVMKALLSVFQVSGFNWTIQEGDEAGQTVPHLHLHLIPRRPNDLPQPGDWYPLMLRSEREAIDSVSRKRLPDEEMRRMVLRLRKEVTPFGAGPG